MSKPDWVLPMMQPKGEVTRWLWIPVIPGLAACVAVIWWSCGERIAIERETVNAFLGAMSAFLPLTLITVAIDMRDRRPTAVSGEQSRDNSSDVAFLSVVAFFAITMALVIVGFFFPSQVILCAVSLFAVIFTYMFAASLYNSLTRSPWRDRLLVPGVIFACLLAAGFCVAVGLNGTIK